MPTSVNSRPYDNSRRAAAARQTRRAIVEAARALFLADGYAPTSLNAIAKQAGVSVQTVYSQFGNKRTLLKEVMDQAVAGDDRPVPINAREQMEQLRTEPDPRRKLRLFARAAADIATRALPVYVVLRSAAATDADADEQLQRDAANRRRSMQEMAEHLAAAGALRTGLSVTEAADRMAAVILPDLYEATVVVLAWTREQYEDWLTELLIASLVTPAPPV